MNIYMENLLKKSMYLGQDLPKNTQEGMLLEKNGNKYEIATKTTKIISQKLQEMAEQLANIQEDNLQKYRKEDNLYVVAQKNLHSAYLQDINTYTVFEEVNFPRDVFSLLCNDAVVRYKDGKYIYEEDLTRRNMY